MLLLLVAGTELFACELMEPDQCESFSAPVDQRVPDDGCCICCCAHILLMDAQRLVRVEGWVPVPDLATPSSPEFELARIYHPPKF
jgi:hypothetical protein